MKSKIEMPAINIQELREREEENKRERLEFIGKYREFSTNVI